MTFWEDLKGFFSNVASMVDIFGFGQYITERINYIKEEKELDTYDKISAMHDEMIKDYSETLGLIPTLLNPPVFNTLYSSGVNVLVDRRVKHAYQANLLGVNDYITYYNRFPEKGFDLRFYLAELGFDQEQEQILNDLYKYYPNPEDFIRFGVREVFKPNICAKYGYDQDFPEEIKPHMHKAGLTDEVMLWFWRAHWQLPSFYNIRDMVFRGVITEQEVKEWLEVNDYAPYWRDNLLKIIYEPYTRVDIRRMYDSGVVDRDEVKRTYLDLGYDDTHAENLTKFTVVNSDKTKNVLSTYLKAYKNDLIDESELKRQMQEMEYSDKEIDLRIQLLNMNQVVERPKKHLTLTNVKKLFKEGFIDSDTLEDMLIELNYDDEAVKYMKMLIISECQPYKVWVSEIKKAYKEDLLTRDETTNKLMSLGYTAEAIKLALDLIDLKKESESTS